MLRLPKIWRSIEYHNESVKVVVPVEYTDAADKNKPAMHDKTSVKKILVLSANPKGINPLRLDEEIREIKQGLRLARERDRFLIESFTAVRYRDIRREILRFQPQIVHFSGHGMGKAGLAFEDETGQQKFVDEWHAR
ncbi:MAG: hypothetical protein MJK14_09095 [Rivularia sp. ALOHA_DT_140]|nr:hypothetical protein [Rivularia sp. ALOHA_DT_140]